MQGGMRRLINLVEGSQRPREGEALAEAGHTSKFGEARGFGRWLTDLYEKGGGDDLDDLILDHDYDDDSNGRPLRYRLMVRAAFREFVRDAAPQMAAKGWALTAEFERNHGIWQLVFEPIRSARTRRSTVFWHVTPEGNVANIQAGGLLPQNSRFGFNYPQKRVYLIRNQADAERMCKSLSQRDEKPVQYALLKVDLRRASGIELHVDPELAKVAVYTTQAIPAKLIQPSPDFKPPANAGW